MAAAKDLEAQGKLYMMDSAVTSVGYMGQEPDKNVHRSDAEELISKVDIIYVDGPVALCDGGGGALGHPLEYIQLDKKNPGSPSTCKYCGLRYAMKGAH